MADRGSRLVYSTGPGKMCPGCGWPVDDCKCSSSAATESVPARIVAKLRMEKTGRGGKTVTVVVRPAEQRGVSEGAQPGAQARVWHRRRGPGGRDRVQGDLRERVRAFLQERLRRQR